MKGNWSVLLLVIAAILIAGVAQTGLGHTVLRGAGLFETPVSYTELNFTNPGAIPEIVPSGSSPVNVSFDISNVSETAKTYRWSILQVSSGKGQVKASGVAMTSVHETESIGKTIKVSCTGGRIQVVVRLANPAESIDFWLTCQNSNAGARNEQK